MSKTPIQLVQAVADTSFERRKQWLIAKFGEAASSAILENNEPFIRSARRPPVRLLPNPNADLSVAPVLPREIKSLLVSREPSQWREKSKPCLYFSLCDPGRQYGTFMEMYRLAKLMGWKIRLRYRPTAYPGPTLGSYLSFAWGDPCWAVPLYMDAESECSRFCECFARQAIQDGVDFSYVIDTKSCSGVERLVRDADNTDLIAIDLGITNRRRVSMLLQELARVGYSHFLALHDGFVEKMESSEWENNSIPGFKDEWEECA